MYLTKLITSGISLEARVYEQCDKGCEEGVVLCNYIHGWE